MFPPISTTYMPPKPEEEKSIAANYRGMIKNALTATIWTTASNLYNGFMIYNLVYQEEGSTLEKFALGGLVTAICQTSNLGTFDLISDIYQDEKKTAKIKKEFAQALSKKDAKTIESMIAEHKYLQSWAGNFKKKEWMEYSEKGPVFQF